MEFPFGTTLFRLRAELIEDPYSDEMVPGDWSNPDELEIPGAFIAQTSTSMIGGVTREQALESKSLFCDGGLDIRKGDRIRNGPEGAEIYTIAGIPPEADVNPFTGWSPQREIPLVRGVG